MNKKVLVVTDRDEIFIQVKEHLERRQMSVERIVDLSNEAPEVYLSGQPTSVLFIWPNEKIHRGDSNEWQNKKYSFLRGRNPDEPAQCENGEVSGTVPEEVIAQVRTML